MVFTHIPGILPLCLKVPLWMDPSKNTQDRCVTAIKSDKSVHLKCKTKGKNNIHFGLITLYARRGEVTHPKAPVDSTDIKPIIMSPTNDHETRKTRKT